MRRAQTWIFEFIISFLIFVGLILLSLSILNSASPESEFGSVIREADHLSSLLISQGSPDDWNVSDVRSIGLTSNTRINTSKLSEFDSLDYYSAKSLLGIHNDFAFYFENASGTLNVEGDCLRGFVGGCDNLLDVIAYDDLAVSTRVVILNSSIANLVVVVWQ